MVFGIAHHSPVDIDALIPEGVLVTVDPSAEADVLYSSTIRKTNIPVQLVFRSSEFFISKNIKILDELSGNPITLRSVAIDKIVAKIKKR